MKSSYGVRRTREKFMLLCVLNSLSGTNWTMSLLILVPCLSTSGLSSASKVSCKSKENSVPSWANKRYTIIMWARVPTHTHIYTHKVEVVLTIFVKSAEPTPTMTIDSGSLEAATTLSIVLSMSVMTPSYTRRQRQHGLVN